MKRQFSDKDRPERPATRRDFLKASAAVSALTLSSGLNTPPVNAAGSDKIRIGLIGCGERGSIDAVNCVNSAPGIELYAMGDLFDKRRDHDRRIGMETAYGWLKGKLGDKMNVTDDRSFVGFDAYEKVLQCDVDLVLLTAPPHFRPQHLRAAVEAGKHVFMEKPVAVDPVGVRSVIESSELARNKGLAILAGTQKRHDAGYRAVMERIHRGDLGELVGGSCYYNGTCRGPYMRPPDMSDMEWQIRNWYFFTWLSGDHIVEQHIHNMDVMNWAFQAVPVKCVGMGGRQVRVGDEHGNIYDHFSVEYEYPNGARVLSMCRQIRGCSYRMSERIVGTKGTSDAKGKIEGENRYEYDGEIRDPSIQEHTDLIESIRKGVPLNEGKRVAETTLMAIMGRMSAYTGNELSWDWVMQKSALDLSPMKYEFGPLPVEPVAMPGQTKLA